MYGSYNCSCFASYIIYQSDSCVFERLWPTGAVSAFSTTVLSDVLLPSRDVYYYGSSGMLLVPVVLPRGDYFTDLLMRMGFGLIVDGRDD